MAYRCDICGKSKQFGQNKPNSQHRTKRAWDPNLQIKRVFLGPNRVTLRVCTRCLKQIKHKQAALAAKPAEPEPVASQKK
ncbi:50S ribosomal protein L28 [Candidatus Microgenomates bacterium]|nr:50S ribosomal protein L28 [Candidatus Microgenomates bacterium]